MKRPMCVIGLTLALTTLAALLCVQSSTLRLLLSAAAASTGMLLLLLDKRRLRLACLALFSAAVGLAAVALHHSSNIAPFVKAAGETVSAQGLVTEATKGNRAIFYTVSARFPDRPDLPDTTLNLRAFGEMDHGEGDVIGFAIKLDDEVAAPGDYTFAHGGFASGYAVGATQRLSGGYPFQRRLIALRFWMQENTYRHLPADSADIVTAMVLGLKDNVDADTYNAVNRAGTAHLLTVSGLHLSILTGMLLTILEKLRLPKGVAAVTAIGGALLFSALVGFSASILRSFLMTAIALTARTSHRRGDSLSSLSFAVAVICLIWPHWVLGRGFWFSAGSTLGIVLFTGKLEKIMVRRFLSEDKLQSFFARTMLGAGAISIAAYTFTLPLLILFNGWMSLVSPIANVLVTPFTTPLILGGIVCALVPGSGLPIRVIAGLTDFCTAMTMQISRTVAALPLATVPLDETWMLFWLLMVTAGAILLMIWKADRRLILYGCLLAVTVFGAGGFSQTIADRGKIQLSVIEGCNTAVLLREKEAVILGTPNKSEINSLLRYLEFRNVESISAIVAPDCGEQVGSGLLRLGERYPIGCIVGPNDAYILGQIATAMDGIPVYSGGYASVEVLGGAKIDLILPEGDLLLTTRTGTIFKSTGEYGILENTISHPISLYPDGIVKLSGARGLEPTPVGTMIFGEKRFRLLV